MTADTLVGQQQPIARADHATLAQAFTRQVQIRGEHPALCFRVGGRYTSISWAQFGDAAARIAAYLYAEGVEEGGRVAIWSSNRPEWHIADAAIITSRACAVPIYLTLSPDQARYILDHSGTSVIFVEGERLLARVLEVRSELPELRRVVVLSGIDSPSPDGFVIPWQQALTRGQVVLGTDQAGEVTARCEAVRLDDVATLIYTSGTTGPPKAVQITHANVAAANAGLSTFITASAEDRVLSYLPLAHVAERLASEFRSYLYGNPTYFLDGLENLGDRLREVRPTLFFGVPRVWEKMRLRILNSIAELSPPRRRLARWAIEVGIRMGRCVDRGVAPSPGLARRHHWADRLVLRNIREQLGLDQARVLVCGAAPVAVEVLHFFRALSLTVHEAYGQTENCAVCCMNRPDLHRVGSVGPPVPSVEVRIADDGEILMRGPMLMPGYFRDEEATNAAIIDGWLHTGDVGWLDDQGILTITDRKKDIIITAGGKNISPANIEGALTTHALIGHAVVIGDRRPFVSALLTLDADQAPREVGATNTSLTELAASPVVAAQIRDHVRSVNSQLSGAEQVKRWLILPAEFRLGEELTPTLKVRRRVVAERYAAEINSLYSGGGTSVDD